MTFAVLEDGKGKLVALLRSDYREEPRKRFYQIAARRRMRLPHYFALSPISIRQRMVTGSGTGSGWRAIAGGWGGNLTSPRLRAAPNETVNPSTSIAPAGFSFG
jgi:hypothetical protein